MGEKMKETNKWLDNSENAKDDKSMETTQFLKNAQIKPNSTKLSINKSRSSKETKDGKEEWSSFSIEYEHTSQPSKKALPKGNWVQKLGVFNALYTLIKILFGGQ